MLHLQYLVQFWNHWYENEKLERVHWKAIKIVRSLEPKLCKERLREMSYLAWRRQEGNQLHHGWEERRQSQTLLRDVQLNRRQWSQEKP